MPDEPRTLADWLSQRPSIRDALSRSQHLTRMNRAFHEWLREPWAPAVRLARVEGRTAVFFAADATASTMLHFHGPAVLSFLREHCDCPCDRLQIRVRPEAYGQV